MKWLYEDAFCFVVAVLKCMLPLYASLSSQRPTRVVAGPTSWNFLLDHFAIQHLDLTGFLIENFRF